MLGVMNLHDINLRFRSEKVLELILFGILVVLIIIARNIKLIGEKLLNNSEEQSGVKNEEE